MSKQNRNSSSDPTGDAAVAHDLDSRRAKLVRSLRGDDLRLWFDVTDIETTVSTDAERAARLGMTVAEVAASLARVGEKARHVGLLPDSDGEGS